MIESVDWRQDLTTKVPKFIFTIVKEIHNCQRKEIISALESRRMEILLKSAARITMDIGVIDIPLRDKNLLFLTTKK